MTWPEGWFPDPTGRFEHRYFNGRSWTADVSIDGRRHVDPLGSRVPPAGSSVAPPPRPGSPPPGSGMAVAAMVCGIVGVVMAWMPVFAVIGIPCALVALGLGLAARRRLRPQRSATATTGWITGIAGTALGVLGLILTVSFVSAFERYSDPPPASAEITACELTGNAIDLAFTITNEGGDTTDFSLFVEATDGNDDHRTGFRVAVDDAPPAEPAKYRIRLEPLSGAFGDSPTCTIARIDGPLPWGIDIDDNLD